MILKRRLWNQSKRFRANARFFVWFTGRLIGRSSLFETHKTHLFCRKNLEKEKAKILI